jgi:predicted acetyltransferase
MVYLERITKEHEQTLHNLMQFYIYEFSKFIPAIKLEKNGAYSPFDLKNYWEDEYFHAFLIKLDTELIGFALIECGTESTPHSINEFFVLKKYSGKGFGSQAAIEVFNRFPGAWKITQISNNYPAQAFWRKVIMDYTNDTYSEYYDENHRSIQEFDTTARGNDIHEK